MKRIKKKTGDQKQCINRVSDPSNFTTRSGGQTRSEGWKKVGKIRKKEESKKIPQVRASVVCDRLRWGCLTSLTLGRLREHWCNNVMLVLRTLFHQKTPLLEIPWVQSPAYCQSQENSSSALTGTVPALDPRWSSVEQNPLLWTYSNGRHHHLLPSPTLFFLALFCFFFHFFFFLASSFSSFLRWWWSCAQMATVKPPVWVDESRAKDCAKCQSPFSMFNRKVPVFPLQTEPTRQQHKTRH